MPVWEQMALCVRGVAAVREAAEHQLALASRASSPARMHLRHWLTTVRSGLGVAHLINKTHLRQKRVLSRLPRQCLPLPRSILMERSARGGFHHMGEAEPRPILGTSRYTQRSMHSSPFMTVEDSLRGGIAYTVVSDRRRVTGSTRLRSCRIRMLLLP